MHSMKPIPHGTQNGYGNYRCRCDECRKANTETNRRLRLEGRDGSTCFFDRCERPAFTRGLCYAHYRQLVDRGYLTKLKIHRTDLSDPPNEGVCPRGHLGEYVLRKSGKWDCRGCDRERRREYRLRGERKRTQPQHGTSSEYDNFGCRCLACKAANARRSLERTVDLKAELL